MYRVALLLFAPASATTYGVPWLCMLYQGYRQSDRDEPLLPAQNIVAQGFLFPRPARPETPLLRGSASALEGLHDARMGKYPGKWVPTAYC